VWQAAVQNGSKAAYEQYKASYCPGGLHCAQLEEIINAIKYHHIDMVLVNGGTFTRGCTNEHQDCGSNEQPAHEVTVGDFYMGRYEVTQRLWKEVMGKRNPSNFKSCDECPVENVSWDDVQKFIAELNRQTGRQYRLPTEAEWEYAARGGGKQVMFGNGKNVADPKEINFNGDWNPTNYSVKGIDRGKTVPVGSLNSPNALGLHDMSGNVWEWCSDWYSPDYYEKSPSSNPTGPGSGSYRVRRGGSWNGSPAVCRVAVRQGSWPNYRGNGLGFRLARTN
jgi:formylglycine-generating enzyme required for sulfatase activity